MIPKNKVVLDKENHRYYADKDMKISVPNFSSIIKEVLGNNYARVPQDILDKAIIKGNGVHRVTELYDKHNEITTDDFLAYENYLKGWTRFKKDFGILDKEFDLIEIPLLSKKHWYATMPDRLINGILINIKTGKENKNHRLQTAAESIVIEENFDIKVSKRMIVTLKEDSYLISEHNDNNDFDNWISINKTFQWKCFQ